MTLVTLRPNGTVSNTGTLTGGATAHAVLSDNSDASYISFAGDPAGGFNGQNAVLNFADLTLPAGAVVKTVALRVRSADAIFYSIIPWQGTGSPPIVGGFGGAFTPTITTYQVGSATPGWTDPQIDAVTGYVGALASANRVFEVYIDVRLVAVPVVTVTGPTGTITNTNLPTTTWTEVLDSDGGAQTAFEVKVFNATQYGAGGFSPDTSSPTIASGITASAAQSWLANATLVNDTYRSYVRAAQTVNGTQTWSAWAFSGFVVNVAIPAIPTLVLAVDNTLGRVRATMTAVAGAATTDALELQRASADYARNEIKNPSATFNVIDGGWGCFGAALTRGTFKADTGVASFRMQANAAGTMGLRHVGERFTVTEGLAYSAAAKFSTLATPRTCVVQTDFYDAAGARISVTSGASITDTTTDFTRAIIENQIAPVGAVSAQIIAQVNSVALNEVHFVDSLIFVQATTVPEYFDGDSPGYHWTGTPHASPSQRGDWLAVRNTLGDNGILLNAANVPVHDYEAPNGVPTRWRARALHDYSGIYAASAWAYATATWTSSDWWIKHPNRPAFNFQLTKAMFSYADVNHAARQTAFQPLGATLPVVVSDTRGGATGTVVVQLRTVQEQAALDLLLDSIGTFLLQGPAAHSIPDRYVRFGDHARVRVIDKGWSPITRDTLPWTEVKRPAGAQT